MPILIKSRAKRKGGCQGIFLIPLWDLTFYGSFISRKKSLLETGIAMHLIGSKHTSGLWVSVAFRYMMLNEVPPLIKVLRKLLTNVSALHLGSPWSSSTSWQLPLTRHPPAMITACNLLNKLLFLILCISTHWNAFPPPSIPQLRQPSFGPVENSNSSFKISAQHHLLSTFPDL